MPEHWKKGLLAAGWNLGTAVQLAIEIEEMGRTAYARMARRWETSPALRELFDRLAAEEGAHLQELQALLDGAEREQRATGLDVESLRAIARTSFFPGDRGALGTLEELSSPREILEVVLRFERATWMYYRGLRDVLGPGETVDFLVEQEAQHAAMVERELEAVERRAEAAGGAAPRDRATS